MIRTARRNAQYIQAFCAAAGGLGFVVSDEDENEIARLKELNSELESSIKRCRAILNDCRKRLAANTNVREPLTEDEESLRG